MHEVDDEKAVTFRFHGKSKLQGGTSVTVSNLFKLENVLRGVMLSAQDFQFACRFCMFS